MRTKWPKTQLEVDDLAKKQYYGQLYKIKHKNEQKFYVILKDKNYMNTFYKEKLSNSTRFQLQC